MTLALAVAVWLLWSLAVAYLPAAGFRYSLNQLFWLAALPGLAGATLRVFYAIVAPAFGSRRFWMLSLAGLLLPMLGVGLAVQQPTWSFEAMVMLALLIGLGVAHVMYAAGPRACSDRADLAERGDLDAAAASAPPGAVGAAESVTALARSHLGRMAWLQLGTAGSVLGHLAALPLLLHNQAQEVDALPLLGAGALLAALAWPLGRHLAERVGAARVSLWSFAAMALAVAVVARGLPDGPAAPGSAAALTAGFLLLMAAAGLGRGSTLCMVRAICARQGGHAASAAAVVGLASAVGAYGGFVVPKGYGTAIALTGSPLAALVLFFLFYVTCIGLTWWHYGRRFAPMPC